MGTRLELNRYRIIITKGGTLRLREKLYTRFYKILTQNHIIVAVASENVSHSRLAPNISKISDTIFQS